MNHSFVPDPNEMNQNNDATDSNIIAVYIAAVLGVILLILSFFCCMVILIRKRQTGSFASWICIKSLLTVPDSAYVESSESVQSNTAQSRVVGREPSISLPQRRQVSKLSLLRLLKKPTKLNLLERTPCPEEAAVRQSFLSNTYDYCEANETLPNQKLLQDDGYLEPSEVGSSAETTDASGVEKRSSGRGRLRADPLPSLPPTNCDTVGDQTRYELVEVTPCGKVAQQSASHSSPPVKSETTEKPPIMRKPSRLRKVSKPKIFRKPTKDQSLKDTYGDLSVPIVKCSENVAPKTDACVSLATQSNEAESFAVQNSNHSAVETSLEQAVPGSSCTSNSDYVRKLDDTTYELFDSPP